MNDGAYDQREALYEERQKYEAHRVERRSAGRVAYDPSPRADQEAKMRAWQNTLEKASHILQAHGHCGDAATLKDIARMLKDVKP